MEFLTKEEENFLTVWVKENSGFTVTSELLYDVVCFARIWVAEGGYKDPNDIWKGFSTSPVGLTYFS